MTYVRLTLVLASIAAAVSLAAQPVAVTAADAIRNAPGRGGTYAWVDAGSATDSLGRLRSDKFGAATEGMEQVYGRRSGPSDTAITDTSRVSTLQAIAESDEDSACPGVVNPPADDPGSRGLRSRVKRATGIYVAVARKVTPGFSYADPASLIEADPVEIVRDVPGRNTTSNRLFVTYDFARFRVGSIVACVGTEPIREGDRFLVLTFGSPLDRTGYLIRARHYVYIDDGGKVRSPDHASAIRVLSPAHSAAPPTFNQFVDLVKSLASQH